MKGPYRGLVKIQPNAFSKIPGIATFLCTNRAYAKKETGDKEIIFQKRNDLAYYDTLFNKTVA